MNERLALRLLNALPAGACEVTALLGLLRIEESRDVPPAAVTCERRPVLKLNPDFVASHCASDGYLGPPKAAMTERIRKARLDVRVLLTPSGWRPDLPGVASRLVPLPELSSSPRRRSA